MSIGQRLSTAVRDVRALGPGAPLRLGLELSKRTGLHRALFGRLARAETADGLTFVLPFAPPPIGRIPDTARARTLREAATIASGTVEIFGVPLDLGSDPDWHAALDGPERWPALPWWQIDIRSSARLGDVKWVWELGRHRHLVVLARAAALEPDGPWAAALEQQLTSWLDANPFEIGIHWYSNLEIALRAIAWVQILGLAGSQLPDALGARMHATLYHSGRHLLADVPYTVSTMRNNHLLGDALGLCVLGRCFADDRRARRWRVVGDRLFDRQVATQMHDDGSMLEDSVSYHRFVLEMLAVRGLVGEVPPDGSTALAQAAAFLVRLGALDGEVPRYGDGDEGRVLVAARDPDPHAGASDLVGSIHAAFVLADPSPPRPTMTDPSTPEEVVWYPAPRRPSPAAGAATAAAAASSTVTTTTTTTPTSATPPALATAESHGHAVGGGVARAAAGPFTVWLKAGGDWSHGHADLCSTAIRFDDEWVVGDPGTGTYNGPPEQRDYFRTSIAHSVLRLDDLDQLEPHRAFRWRYPAVGAIGEPLSIDAAVVLWGWHGSYQRLDPSRRVVRAVVLDTIGTGVTVVDWVEGEPGIPYALSLPLPPGAVLEGERVRLASRRVVGLRIVSLEPPTIAQHRGQADPFDGWWSRSYGTIEPSTRVEATGTVRGPIAWQIAGTVDAAPPLRVDDTSVTVGALTLSVEIGSASIELIGRTDGALDTRRRLDT